MLTDIVVHMDRAAGCTARLMAAINLAMQHRARLKGLYVISHPHYASSSDYLSDFGQVRDFFINATSKAGVDAEWLLVDWSVVGTPMHQIVARYAYYADTVLVGQPPYLQSRKTSLDFHEGLFLSSGRPVIVFPAYGEIFKLGSRIMVAWKGGRESVRAVHDSLPLMRQAASVSIVAVSSSRDEQIRERQAIAAMCDHLERAGIKASGDVVTPVADSICDTLLVQASQEQADLLVVGAFAYKSSRAPVLSPLTRDLLVKSNIPLLVSH